MKEKMNLPANIITNNIISSSNKSAVKDCQLMKVFEDELKDIYWSEKELLRSISNMIQNASSNILIEALETHLQKKGEQIKRVENAFELIEKNPIAKKCKAIAYLIDETEEMMNVCDAGILRDMEIISGSQKIEHYEIGAYATLCEFAENIGIRDVASILKKTLIEEIVIHKKLSQIAECI